MAFSAIATRPTHSPPSRKLSRSPNVSSRLDWGGRSGTIRPQGSFLHSNALGNSSGALLYMLGKKDLQTTFHKHWICFALIVLITAWRRSKISHLSHVSLRLVCR